MNILRFPTNTPIQVAINTPQGTIVQGRYGDRVLFHLTDGRVMYVPPIVASKIEAQGIAPGEPFELCKAQVRTGQTRSIEWWLKRTPPEPAEHEDAQKAVEPENNLEFKMIPPENPENGNAHPPSRNGGLQDAIPKNGTHQNGTQKSIRQNGASKNSTAQNEPNQNQASQNQSSQPASSTKLEHALKTAISAAHNAEKYGTELGYVVRFDADAIKSMAITVLINMSDGARR
jgi:hypothetical protein